MHLSRQVRIDEALSPLLPVAPPLHVTRSTETARSGSLQLPPEMDGFLDEHHDCQLTRASARTPNRRSFSWLELSYRARDGCTGLYGRGALLPVAPSDKSVGRAISSPNSGIGTFRWAPRTGPSRTEAASSLRRSIALPRQMAIMQVPSFEQATILANTGA